MARSMQLSRRDYLRMAALGVGFGGAGSWLPTLAAETEGLSKNKAVILLWLSGGPATIDIWDLKPGNDNGGEFKEISTATPGIRLSEHLPKLAQQTNDLAIIRSMHSKEGDHGRATQFVRTGYAPQGAIKFPTFGSLCSHELGNRKLDLPSFVSISGGRGGRSSLGGGFLGPEYSPLVIGGEGRGSSDLVVPNLQRGENISDNLQTKRIEMLNRMDDRFQTDRSGSVVGALSTASHKAVRLMRPEAAAAFRLEDEPEELRDQYGRDSFGQGCLMARRLIERGITFVEVTLGGWDTHNENFEQVARLSANLDVAFSALLSDLKSRGMLESTVVICQGEFGRTPRINGRSGRDHWPHTWATVLAGGGIRGGQVIGATSADGTEVTDRPVTVPDVITTVCQAIDIDPMKQNMSNVGRPIRIADPEAKPIEELL